MEIQLPGRPLTPAPSIAGRPPQVLLTGATGFLGQAVLERLLATTDAHVHVLIRPRGSHTGRGRLDRLLRKAVFGPLVERLGAAAGEVVERRVSVVEGSLGELPELPSDLDVVIHSASSVVFDDPIDHAFATNVDGPAALYAALERAGGDPHVVHVSTCYVQTGRAGVAREARVEHDIDPYAESAEVAEQARRFAERLDPEALAAALRRSGRDRARAHGFTDVYTFTKALGERVAETAWAGAGHRLSIVRPTIIESALTTPFPGWIDGFKVADPLIAAYARGALTGFPGRPDAVLDVVPVDQVVSTILAASALPPAAGAARYLQVGSSVSNPLTLADLRHHVQSYFAVHPWVRRDGVTVRATPWEFGDPGAVRRRLDHRLALVDGAARMLRHAPARRSADRLESLRGRLETMRRLVDLYEPYTCATTVYDDAATRALHARLGAGWSVGDIDWTAYLRGRHLPAVVGLMRGRPPRASKAATRPTAPKATPATITPGPAPGDHATDGSPGAVRAAAQRLGRRARSRASA